jgi:hypothetical protein
MKAQLVNKLKVLECYCAPAGKTGGAIRVGLDFFALLFASRQKVEKERLKAESIKAARRDPSCLGMTSKRDYNSRQVFNAVYRLLRASQ